MFLLRIANLCAVPTALGQYGHVGVTNTFIVTGLSILLRISMAFDETSASHFETFFMSSMSDPNSYPEGRPEEAGVSSVPHIVINGEVEFVGAYPDEQFAM